jgi:hypothetical protein
VNGAGAFGGSQRVFWKTSLASSAVAERRKCQQLDAGRRITFKEVVYQGELCCTLFRSRTAGSVSDDGGRAQELRLLLRGNVRHMQQIRRASRKMPRSWFRGNMPIHALRTVCSANSKNRGTN